MSFALHYQPHHESHTSVLAKRQIVQCQRLVQTEPRRNECYELHGGLDSFFAFFFSPHDVLCTCQPESVPLYRGGGVLQENEDWSATHKDG